MNYKDWIEGRANYAKGGPVEHPKKVEKVMGEFKRGTLHSGSKSGPTVTNPAQAKAIALSEARKKRGYEEGGSVAGPGGPTDDAVPANLSNGEYVIPADVVHFLGTAFFDRLLQQTQAEMGAGQQAPGPWDDMAANDMGEMEPGGMPGMPPRVA